MNATLPFRQANDSRGTDTAEAERPVASVRAILALIADKGPAGRLLRLVLPIAIFFIFLSGAAIVAGHYAGYLGATLGTALFAGANGLIVTAAIFWSAWLLQAEFKSRRHTQEEIRHHSLHDPLTGLANRGFFMEQLARRSALAERRTSVPFAVCSLDIDGFKRINEQLGREAGDRILVKVGDVIRECVRASDLVARLDGDKFGILLEEIADARDVNILAQRIVASVPRELEASEFDLRISVSIGIALKSSGHEMPSDLLRDADAALLTAQTKGPGRFELTAFAS